MSPSAIDPTSQSQPLSSSSKWEDIAAAKRASVLKSIPSEWIIPADLLPDESYVPASEFPQASGWFAADELEITESTAVEILEKIRARTWTASKVTLAFCKKAAAAHQLVNCLSETMFSDAIATAKRLDDYQSSTGQLVGPLHGLPVSIKDNFNYVGKDSTVGFVSWVGKPATENSVLVDTLLKAGAVLYVKTTTPTAMMIAETVSNVSGRTINPLRRTLAAGGSSGGESALIAFGGSPLGVGTDIGGSLRIPASAVGIFTLKPSLGRFPTGGCTSGLAGQEAVPSTNGPMAPTLEGVELFAKSIVDSEPWLIDAKAIPIPWRTVEAKQKLKIGVVWDDGMVIPTPPVQRALRETVEKLRQAGHEVVDWSSEGSHETAARLLSRFFTADGGETCRKALNPVNEPWRPEMEEMYATATDLSCYGLWQAQLERASLTKKYVDRWAASGVDLILSPTTPWATVKHGGYIHVAYTGIWNIMDYPAVSWPTGINVTPADEKAPREFLSPLDERIDSEYDVNAIQDMPISLQLIGRRLHEEELLANTRTVLDAMKI